MHQNFPWAISQSLMWWNIERQGKGQRYYIYTHNISDLYHVSRNPGCKSLLYHAFDTDSVLQMTFLLTRLLNVSVGLRGHESRWLCHPVTDEIKTLPDRSLPLRLYIPDKLQTKTPFYFPRNVSRSCDHILRYVICMYWYSVATTNVMIGYHLRFFFIMAVSQKWGYAYMREIFLQVYLKCY